MILLLRLTEPGTDSSWHCIYGGMRVLVLIYFTGINLLAFILYGLDKQKARKHRYRISERLLLGVAVLGGALGALLGMIFFHHKTRKPLFRIWIPSLLVFYLLLFLILTVYSGRARSGAFSSLEADSNMSVTYETNNLLLLTPEKPRAGIIFYPGAFVQFEAYGPLMRKCAERGYACFIVRMPLNLAVLNRDGAKEVKDYYTGISHWFLAGHSMGAAMAASYGAEHPEDYDGLVLLAGYSEEDLSDSGLDVLSIYGSRDGVLNMEKYRKYKSNLPDSFEEYVIEGGNHAFFGDYGDQSGDREALISREEQMDRTASRMAAFIEKCLRE